jgi:hypothetical protein
VVGLEPEPLRARPKRPPLDLSQIVAVPLGPHIRGKVTIGNGEVELPHDDAAALADLVECVYILYGWTTVVAIAAQLRAMLALFESEAERARREAEERARARVREAEERERTSVRDTPEHGTALPGEQRRARGAQPTGPLPGGTIVLDERPPEPPPPPEPPLPDWTVEQLKLWRLIGAAGVDDVRAWAAAFDAGCAHLRLRLLDVARTLELAALGVLDGRVASSHDVVGVEFCRYFREAPYERGKHAQEVRRSLEGGEPPSASDEPLADLRMRLREGLPLAEAAERANDAVGDWETQKRTGLTLARHQAKQYRQRQAAKLRRTGFVEEQGVDDLEYVQRERKRVADRALVMFKAAASVQGASEPILYRVDPKTWIEAMGADFDLGELVFNRLAKTWTAAFDVWVELHENLPAKEVDETEVRAGARPERLIADDVEDSVWAHAKILEVAVMEVPPEDLELAEVVAANVRALVQDDEEEQAWLSIAASIGLTAATLGLMFICPPAGIALDAGLAVADVYMSVEAYDKLSDLALCHLNPRESLAEVEPSMVPIVLAVAGAAMVAL